MGTYLWPTFRQFGSDSCGIPRQLWLTWAEAASYEQAKDFVDANRQVATVASVARCHASCHPISRSSVSRSVYVCLDAILLRTCL